MDYVFLTIIVVLCFVAIIASFLVDSVLEIGICVIIDAIQALTKLFKHT